MVCIWIYIFVNSMSDVHEMNTQGRACMFIFKTICCFFLLLKMFTDSWNRTKYCNEVVSFPCHNGFVIQKNTLLLYMSLSCLKISALVARTNLWCHEWKQLVHKHLTNAMIMIILSKQIIVCLPPSPPPHLPADSFASHFFSLSTGYSTKYARVLMCSVFIIF